MKVAVIIAVLFAVTAAKPQARPKKTAYKHAHAYGPPYKPSPKPYKEEELPRRARRQTFYYPTTPNHAPAAPKVFEWGYRRGNDPQHFREEYLSQKDHTFKAKLRWGDAYEGQGEQFYDFNPLYNDEAPKPYKEEELPHRARRQTFYYPTTPNHAPAAPKVFGRANYTRHYQ